MPNELVGRRGHLIAMVISEEQLLRQIETEVGPILSSAYASTCMTATVMYVISLGQYALAPVQSL